jgi:predicted HD superfamily hydrolase involved in NAD metabolism
MPSDFLPVIDLLRKTLKQQRFSHSLGVAELASTLAQSNGLNGRKAFLAGLLHDCAKGLTAEESLLLLPRARADAFEKKVIALWHAPVGALLARENYRVRDQGVLEAIRSHCCGWGKRKSLAMVLYVADFLEEGRTFSGVRALRNLAARNLAQAFKSVMARKIMHLKQQGRLVHPGSYLLWRQVMKSV